MRPFHPPRHDRPRLMDRPAARWHDGLAAALGSWLAFVALVAMCAPARAQDRLPDPTRPPGVSAAPGGTPAPARTATPPAAPAASAPTLQSLHLPRHGAPSALVDGRIVRPGDRLLTPQGPRVVIAIDRQGLVLQGTGPARTPQRLDLLVGIVRQPSAAGAPAPTTLAASAPGARLAVSGSPPR